MQPKREWRFSDALSYRLLLVTLAVCGAGCANFSTTEAQSSPTVAVLINRTWVEDDPRGFVWEVREAEQFVEEQFAACVRNSISSKGIAVKVITGTEFRSVAFPDLDPRSAPRRLETLRSLISDARFQSRTQAAHIDYLAIVGGKTHTSVTQGGIGCFGGGPAGACFGLLWWDHESRLSALILDLHAGKEQLSDGVDAAGTSWFAIFVAYPLAAPSAHEAKACARFGDAVAAALSEPHRKGD